MKITKTEGIWLIITTILYIAYNIPGVPPYNQPTAPLIHAALTLLPIWVITYIFLPCLLYTSARHLTRRREERRSCREWRG